MNILKEIFKKNDWIVVEVKSVDIYVNKYNVGSATSVKIPVFYNIEYSKSRDLFRISNNKFDYQTGEKYKEVLERVVYLNNFNLDETIKVILKK